MDNLQVSEGITAMIIMLLSSSPNPTNGTPPMIDPSKLN
jgi:hypothetical protein